MVTNYNACGKSVSFCHIWKDKEGIEHYKIYKNIKEITVNGKHIYFDNELID